MGIYEISYQDKMPVVKTAIIIVFLSTGAWEKTKPVMNKRKVYKMSNWNRKFKEIMFFPTPIVYSTHFN